MNKENYFKIAIISGFLLFLGACHSDEKSSETDNISENEWIEDKMRNMYYWYNEIPGKDKLNYESDASDFFTSLLSLKDGKATDNGHHFYSYIEKKNSTRSYMGNTPSLGFEFQLWWINNLNMFAVNIVYVLPNSPASRAGLKRGEWITEIDHAAVDQSNVKKLLEGQVLSLGIAEDAEKPIYKQVTLTPGMVVDNPVFLDTIFDLPKYNKRVGYLVYNHFTSGPGGEKDETFNNSLREAFSRFKAGNINDFILDLRYNLGGIVTSSQLLSTLLAPASALDKVFCYLVYNDKNTSLNRTLYLDSKYMKQGANGENLNLDRLFIITSERTASASEALINGLMPYMNSNIFLIGEKTDGKNVGSISISDTRFDHVLHPIVCQLYNKDNFTDYDNGFDPIFQIRENGTYMEPLGSLDETLLFYTMQYVVFGEIISGNNQRSILNYNNTLFYSSLDRKKLNSTIILPNECDINE